MNNIISPIYLIDGNDIIIFRSLKDFQIYLEPNLVKGDEIVYDSKGQLLRLILKNDTINLSIIDTSLERIKEFEQLLRTYLVLKNKSLASDTERTDLPSLINLSLKHTVKLSVGDYLKDWWGKLFQ